MSSRRRLEVLGERLIEGIILLCVVSAIVFVFAIFFLVCLKGSGVLIKGLNLVQFFTSPEWYPDSRSNVRYGALALLAGTASVTVLAMLLAVPFGLGAALFISEFCGARVKETL